ncbi:MAG: YidH family protein [Candidatus Binatia bacterium]
MELKSVLAGLTSKIDTFFTVSGRREEPGVAKLDFNTRLSVERTLLAYERTLMAWIRTSASLISFGFTIHKFFQLEATGRVATSQVIGPRSFASIMILMGLFALLIATIQHRVNVRRQRSYGVPQRTLVGWVAALISVLGILAMVSVILEL